MKKSRNKAFTLIEIIAIIMIIAIILAITVPSVSTLVNSTYLKTYEIDLTAMKNAASGYVLKTNIEIPSGIQTRIELSDMIEKGVIDKIIDPKTKEECDGYVNVTMLNESYYFIPYLKCGDNYKSPDYGKTDYVLPVITLLGDNPITINVGETYKEPGFTAYDDVDGDITNKVITTGHINPNLPGSYEITYSVTDNANNFYETKRTVKVIDNVPPTIIFGTNGNSTYAKSYSTTVNVIDNAAVNTSSLKYQWTTSTTAPSEASFSTTFTNGGTITSSAGITGSYYLWIIAKDTSGNATITRTNLFNLDNTKPVITLNGSSTVTIELGSTYSDAGATATDAHSGISSSVTATGSVNPSVVGTYTITYNVSDKAGNAADSVTRTVKVVDTTSPTVAFGTNGNSTYAKSYNTTVTVTDIGGVNTSSLKYQWTTSTTAPSEASFSTTFTNGGTITSSAGVTGEYYLWVLAKDTSGNTTIKRTNVFNLDNTPPVITITGSNPVTVNGGSVYSDAGATATDAHSGVNGSVTPTSNVNTNILGSYTVTYTVSDKAGNTATATRTVNVVDNNPPIITANNSSYTITQGASNAMPGTYFTISQNGLATISSTSCIDTSNGNATVTNTSTLSVGTHVIKCTTTKTNGLNANATTTFTVNPAYTCSQGTLTYDASKGGHICVKGCDWSPNYYQRCPDGNTTSASWYPVTCYAGGGTQVCPCNNFGSPSYTTQNTDISVDNSNRCSGNIKIVCTYGGSKLEPTKYYCAHYSCSSMSSYISCPSGYSYNSSSGYCEGTSTFLYQGESSYYCPSGWSNYSGSGSNLKCYKAAQQ